MYAEMVKLYCPALSNGMVFKILRIIEDLEAKSTMKTEGSGMAPVSVSITSKPKGKHGSSTPKKVPVFAIDEDHMMLSSELPIIYTRLNSGKSLKTVESIVSTSSLQITLGSSKITSNYVVATVLPSFRNALTSI